MHQGYDRGRRLPIHSALLGLRKFFQGACKFERPALQLLEQVVDGTIALFALLSAVHLALCAQSSFHLQAWPTPTDDKAWGCQPGTSQPNSDGCQKGQIVEIG